MKRPLAIVIIAGALAAGLAPVDPIAPSAWAADNLIVPDGPRAGSKLDLALTPYLVEPLDFFADACPDNKAVIRKSKQTGFTTLAIAATGYTIDVEPCDLFLIEPTEQNLAEFNALKLSLAIQDSPKLKRKVAAQTARSGRGSTTFLKRFAGGSLLMGISTSTSDLRGKTRKKVIKDEASEYPEDVGGQGSPHDMIAGAYETFLSAGDWKELNISTPVIKGACYIDAEFEKGDQRFWHMDCPNCREPFYFKFKPGKTFCFEQTFPHKAHYVTDCCGAPIEAHEKNALMRTGRWIATAPAPGKFRSYHFDSLSSPFVPWDTIAARYIDAADNPAKLKTFSNLTLGLAYEVKGDVPDTQRLLERREDYQDGHIPARGLLLTTGADVQHTGIWVETVAWAATAESWSVGHTFFEGDTTDHKGGAFAKLADYYDRAFPDAFGATRVIDAMAVDAGDGGRSNQVYAFCRMRPRAFAVKGMAGWTYPAIGTPTPQTIILNGKKIKDGATLWPVGTYSLKATHYANLSKDGRKAGAEVDPNGYCHFHQGCDERFFKQQTAEYLKTVAFKGRTTRVWQETGPNHLLDCRIYAMAMAEYLGLTRMTPDQWVQLAQLRGVPLELQQPDLLAPDSVKIAAAPPRPALIGEPVKARPRVLSRGI